MSGGIVQLVAVGAQDEWLTGKPEISFYRSNYKRHTHYSASAERQIIQGTPLPGGISTIRFEKKGDLMNYVYFVGKDTTGAVVPGVDWSKVIDKLELLVGGQVIDTQDMVWMTQVEAVPGAQTYSTRYLNTNPTGLTNVLNGFLPLKFFFCKDWTSSIPLVALQFHDVEIRITWNNNLGYRVGYEIYSTSYSAAGISTALSLANPITGSTTVGSSGFISATISNGTLSQISTWQSNPFTYSGANFQLVAGMQFDTSTALTGTGFLTVVSVSPSSSTSGTFIGTFQTAPVVSSLAATAIPAYSTVPYNQTNTVLTGGCVGAPAAVTAATAQGSAGFTQAYTVATVTGYLTPGMFCTNLPGSAGSGYVTAVTAVLGPITAFTVCFAASTTTTTISTGIYGFSAPAASQAVRLTYSSGTGTAAITYTVNNSGGGSSTIIGGQIYVGQVLAAGVAGTTTFGAVTTVNLTNGYVTSIVVTYAGNQAPTAPAVDTVLSQPSSVSITSTAATPSGSGSAQLGYSTVVIPATSYLTFGMSISGLPGYNGVGYINGLNSTTPGSQTAFNVYFPFGSTTTTAAIPAGTVALAPVGSIQSTTTAVTIPNVPIYGIGGLAGSATPLAVNSIISNGALTGGATAITGVTFYQISAISYQSAGVALATITALGAVTNGIVATLASLTPSQQALQSSTVVTFSPYFPVLNLLLGSQPTLSISVGMTMGGMVVGQFANIPIATVNNVYSTATQTLVAINTNLLLTATSSALTPTVSTENGYYASASLTLSFIPTTYLTGIISSSTAGITSGSFTAGGGTASVATIGQVTQNGALATTPTRGYSVYIPASMSGVASPATLTNPYSAASTSGQLLVTYSAANPTTVFAQYCQFALVPQGQIQAQITSAGQPQVDRQGAAIISLQSINSAIKTVAVGMTVLGTQYTGPVTVNQVLATNGTFAGSGSATIEIQFPVQSQTSNTTSGASTGLQFIDPTLPLPAGITVSTTGFNGTYQQLQYEAWCNFVFLDQVERDYFTKTTQDMLVTQVQRILIQASNYQEISIAQPVKYIAFLSNNYSTAYQQTQTAGYPTAASYYLKTQINGVDVGDSRSMLQWQDVTQYYHTPYGYNNMGYVAPVALIPYCLDTSKLQPTGTLNFSRLDNYRLVAPTGSSLLQLSGGASYFYAVGYNILRIQNGLGGLLYAN